MCFVVWLLHTRTFAIVNLLFDVVHFQVFGNWSGPGETDTLEVPLSYRRTTSAMNCSSPAGRDAFRLYRLGLVPL